MADQSEETPESETPGTKHFQFHLGPNGHATVGTRNMSFYLKDEEGGNVLVSIHDIEPELMKALGKAIPQAFEDEKKIQKILGS